MRLNGKHVVMFVDEGFEDLEFWVTVMRLREEGAAVTVASAKSAQKFKGKNGLAASSDAGAGDLVPEDFDACVVPGGWAPDKMRRYPAITGFVRRLYEQNKIVGLICHAGLVGISANIVRGHRATGSLGVKDDLVNAGATWVDEAAFRDGCLVWGRVVEDIPDFCRELVTAIEAG